MLGWLCDVAERIDSGLLRVRPPPCRCVTADMVPIISAIRAFVEESGGWAARPADSWPQCRREATVPATMFALYASAAVMRRPGRSLAAHRAVSFHR